MRKIREVVVVEGRYDKNKVLQAVDCTVIETSGFGIFSDHEKVSLLKRLAEKRGIVILTDSDSGGFLIRGHLKGMLCGVNIKQAYIPDIYGREKRKRRPSKEGKLGVEGMSSNVILSALEHAGATFEDCAAAPVLSEPITKYDMYDLGLFGKPGSAEMRSKLLLRLNLPERLSSNALLEVLNILYTKDEFLNSLP